LGTKRREERRNDRQDHKSLPYKASGGRGSNKKKLHGRTNNRGNAVPKKGPGDNG